jgi:hypothetical protein
MNVFAAILGGAFGQSYRERPSLPQRPEHPCRLLPGRVLVLPLRGRWDVSLFHGFRCAPPVATIVRPLWGQEGGDLSERKSQSGDWRAQECPPARPNVDAASCRVLCSTMVRAKAISKANTSSSPYPLVLWLRGQDTGRKRLEASSTLGMPHVAARERPQVPHNVDAASCRVLPAPWRGPKTKEAGSLLYLVCSLWGKDGSAGA